MLAIDPPLPSALCPCPMSSLVIVFLSIFIYSYVKDGVSFSLTQSVDLSFALPMSLPFSPLLFLLFIYVFSSNLLPWSSLRCPSLVINAHLVHLGTHRTPLPLLTLGPRNPRVTLSLSLSLFFSLLRVTALISVLSREL